MTNTKKIAAQQEETFLWAWLLANRIHHRLGILKNNHQDVLKSMRVDWDPFEWDEDDEKVWKRLQDNDRIAALKDVLLDHGRESVDWLHSRIVKGTLLGVTLY